MLSLYEELFLLALDEEQGNYFSPAKKTISYGLAGAILAELALRGKLAMNEKQRLVVQDAAPTGDDILDESLKEMETAEKPRKLVYWVSHFGERPKKLRVQIGECLAARDLVQLVDSRFHWRAAAAPAGNGALSKFQMKHELRMAILAADTAGAEVDMRRLAVLNLLSAAGLLNLVFTVDELPAAQRLIHEIVMRQSLQDPRLQAIEEIEYAVSASIEDSSD
jgi:hypothetical protein